MKRVLLKNVLFVAICCVFLNSCKEDEVKPLLQFQTNNNTYSLNDAKLYLRFEGTYEGAVSYTYRDYLISDGELLEGENGWSLDDYTNATYLIAFELATAKPALPAAGDFPLHRFWDDVTDGSNLSYLFGRFENQTFDTPQTNPTPVIKISGGAEPGGTLTIQFNGQIAWRSDTGTLTPFTGKVDFTGAVIDKRE